MLTMDELREMTLEELKDLRERLIEEAEKPWIDVEDELYMVDEVIHEKAGLREIEIHFQGLTSELGTSKGKFVIHNYESKLTLKVEYTPHGVHLEANNGVTIEGTHKSGKLDNISVFSDSSPVDTDEIKTLFQLAEPQLYSTYNDELQKEGGS